MPTKFKSTLFVQPYDARSEMWTGFRCGPDIAKTLTGVDAALDISELNDYLSGYDDIPLRIWARFIYLALILNVFYYFFNIWKS